MGNVLLRLALNLGCGHFRRERRRVALDPLGFLAFPFLVQRPARVSRLLFRVGPMRNDRGRDIGRPNKLAYTSDW